MIRFACPGCAMEYSVSPSKAGKAGKCPKCGSQFLVPDAADAPAPTGGGTPMNLDPLPGSAPRRSLPDAPPPPTANPGEPVEISPCPGCGARLSVLGGDLGLDVECPTCREVYVAKRAPQAVAPASPPPPSSARSGSSSRRSLLDEANAAEASRGRGRDNEDDDDRRGGDRRSRRRREEEEELDDLPPRRRGRSRRGGGRVVISRVNVLSAGKLYGGFLGGFFLILILLFTGLFLVAALFGLAKNVPLGDALLRLVFAVFILPFVYFVIGFVVGCIAAVVYNAVAGVVGGIELELDDA